MNLSRRGFLRGLAVTAGAGTGLVQIGQAAAKASLSADSVGLLYDATRCIGCNACTVKCREVNKLPPNRTDALHDAPVDLDGSTKNIIKLASFGGAASYVKRQCMHCLDPACVSVCMMGALHKQKNGIVAYDLSRCIGCRYCQIACPFDIPKFEWSKAAPKIVKCELCKDRVAAGKEPGCVEACPRKAVVFGPRDELLRDAHARIAAEPGKYVDKVYGETDAGGTQVLYLAALPFGALGLPDLGNEAMPKLPETIQHGVYRGFIAPAALYGALALVLLRNRKHADEPENKP